MEVFGEGDRFMKQILSDVNHGLLPSKAFLYMERALEAIPSQFYLYHPLRFRLSGLVAFRNSRKVRKLLRFAKKLTMVQST
jgi:hypothetical protein